MSFSGFSEDDIRKLTKAPDVNKPQKGSHKTASKKVTFKPNTTRTKTILNNITNNLPQELPENAKLSVQNNVNSAIKPETQDANPQNEISEEYAKSERKFKDLDEFEARQKLIEEQNRKRKELLAKALADRTRQTQEEAQRLNEIQEEFKKLDDLLSCDVKILRKQIEAASVEYMECQKKYNRIEKEFLDAKLLLHQKQEKKEMLTEHLCTIIEKNEERKAEKLNELLSKLQLRTPEENVVQNGN
ncbi:RAB6-interacting golgin [Tribolium madens]|uniref:RAB6-interacting golgin n=1 Tax=Tribolium madens TaxID=41895 RepID=UPI001CF7528C|nr:RAB6-interacting golgin [Tribolium madens]